ncbi:hypothetical protein ES703_77338 [subsurface metagenome]
MIGIWVTYDAIPWIEKWLQPSHKGWEFGSGYSTVWLGQRVESLTSCEHQLDCYKRVKGLLEKFHLNNVKLIYQPDLKLYPLAIKECPDESLDFVFVDGRQRVRCVQQSWTKVKPDGILILDNSDRPRYSGVFKLLEGWDRLDFRGTGQNPWTKKVFGTWQTSIWTRG